MKIGKVLEADFRKRILEKGNTTNTKTKRGTRNEAFLIVIVVAFHPLVVRLVRDCRRNCYHARCGAYRRDSWSHFLRATCVGSKVFLLLCFLVCNDFFKNKKFL